MFNISKNGIVEMNRGDSIKIPLFINIGDEMDKLRYIIKENDKVYFGVMEANAPFEHSLIRKILTTDNLDENGDVVVELKLNDTQYLQPGMYYYEAKLVRPISGNIDDVESFTVVPRRKIFIYE